ncbi:MAG: hypothetical protein KF778_12775 [Rhodocyclaceae bacterium]|nr:hypothetical protein [Rhodocyclaceae bacterium]MBX3669266.1 hypothetical protein [Rhodocyclaceae bacterium]
MIAARVRSTTLRGPETELSGGDPYRAKLKFRDGTRCPGCGAVYRAGMWAVDADAMLGVYEALCPSCHRVRDCLPAGYLRIDAHFAVAHRDQILQLLEDQHDIFCRAEPLARIMSMQDCDGAIEVTTTDAELARSLGEALQTEYGGEIVLRYNEAHHPVRVLWQP